MRQAQLPVILHIVHLQLETKRKEAQYILNMERVPDFLDSLCFGPKSCDLIIFADGITLPAEIYISRSDTQLIPHQQHTPEVAGPWGRVTYQCR